MSETLVLKRYRLPTPTDTTDVNIIMTVKVMIT